MPLGYYSKYVTQRGALKSCMLFLFHLAWKSRIKLPILIAIGFMVLDIRMQLEINFNMGRGRDDVPDDPENVYEGVEDIDTPSEMSGTEVSETESFSTEPSSDMEEDEKEKCSDGFCCPDDNDGEDKPLLG
ncbi:uncharacterized protein LOC129001792 [Macrosteles quadrilineatus]|uniref:uncharacterized protein LOC129000778 n=1 Tax=Macrosteles quadrilineatus TaxID=74068 RepID=UPI0023E0FBB4|nr:uncharacterized protein LOC129000778 [Macrosteles quadrilineatus]XP_054285211.1 uncharacterized protein LOC129001792 [Macrosteles quadrilineatus]